MKFDIKKHIYLILLFILSFTVETAQSQEVTNIHIAATDTVPTYTSDSAVINFLKDAVPEGVDIQQVKSDLEQLDYVASINQLNLWTMDGLEKNAIVHVCLEHVNHMENCKEAIRTLLKDCGFQNVTIEVDEDLATHRAHKRNIEELEVGQNQGNGHHH